MPAARSDRFQIPEAQHQFGGFGGTIGGGITIPIFGSGGFAGGIRGGLIPGGALGSGGSGIGPVLTLEQAFGVGFTAQDIADQLVAAEQGGRFSTGEGGITITTGPTGLTLVLNLADAIFEIFNDQGQKLGGGVTPEAALVAVAAGAPPAAPAGAGGAVSEPPTFPPTLEAVTTAPFVAPAPPPQQDPNLFGAIQALISILRPPPRFEDIFGRQPPVIDPNIPFPRLPPGLERLPEAFGFPPFPQPERITPLPAPGGPIETVLPGGSVNIPVVLGSTGDPTGIRRPTFPSEENLSRAQQIGQIIRNILALRKARQTADKQRRAFEQFLAARLELLRGAQMPFGQAGFVGPLGGGAIGALTDLAISAGGAFLADRFGGGTALQQFPQLPQAPGLPGIPGLQGGGAFGGGGACPSLFRTGAPAGFSMRPVPWFPVQAPNGKWFFFGHLGTPTFSRLKARRRHHHHARKR